MTSEITRMLRFGTRYSVTLACGHRRDVTRDGVDKEQLFIGKPVECQECGAERKPAGSEKLKGRFERLKGTK